MPTNTTPQFTGSPKAHEQLQESLCRTLFNTLIANRIPISIADKLSRQAAGKIDLTTLYNVVAQDLQAQHLPKQRILDRAIVHMFEILFQVINEQNKEDKVKLEFFNLVPRGECLNLFLQLVKEHCMGDTEIRGYTDKIQPLTHRHSEEGMINWAALYESEQFKHYLSGLLNLILKNLREDHKPIPALENRIPMYFQPYRINSFLNQVCKLKQTGQLNLVLPIE